VPRYVHGAHQLPLPPPAAPLLPGAARSPRATIDSPLGLRPISTLATAEREPEIADPAATADLRHRLRALEAEAFRRGFDVLT
jgi:hypothetical protein